MSSPQPKKLYRYVSFSTITIESLCLDHSFFANPTSFNDPFDCKPTVESDSDSETLRLILKELIKRRVASETLSALKNAIIQGSKAEAHAKRSGEQMASSELANIKYNATSHEHNCTVNEAECWLLTSDIQSELLQRYNRGVCCFSTAFDHHLLWSHYGNQHQGVCVGYSIDRDPKPQLHKVIYGGSRIVKTSQIAKALLENDIEAQNRLDRDVLLRKALPWRYEREWRLLGNRGVQDSVLLLVEVTFGLRCPDVLKYALISSLESREKTVKFFEIYEQKGNFKLKRQPIDTCELRTHFPRTAYSGEELFG